jgi:hypothetical protein
MITLAIIALILGAVLIAFTGLCTILLDPIIAILCVYGTYKVLKWIFK